MTVPANYAMVTNWYFHIPTMGKVTDSIFPATRRSPRTWDYGTIPRSAGGNRAGDSIQGWKLHVGCAPDQIETLFRVTSPILTNVSHKYCPFEEYQSQQIKFRDTSEMKGKAPGKAIAIYPRDPRELATYVRLLDEAIETHNILSSSQLTPYPGGIHGDLELGKTGMLGCRYGGFFGSLARSHMLYNPHNGRNVVDPRFTKFKPDFIRTIPAEISGLIARAN